MSSLTYRLGLATILLLALLQGGRMHLTGDLNMLLHTTAHMRFDGGLYQRWLTVNAPMIYWIFSLPLLAVTELRAAPVAALYGFTLLTCAGALFYADRLLDGHGILPRERRIWMLSAALALLIAPWRLYATCDREHFLFILALPWMLQTLLRFEPRPLSTVLAVLGLCIKPYNLLFLPAMICFGGPAEWRLKRRLFSASSLIAAAMLTAYGVAILSFYPAYPAVMIPVALKSYGAITYSLKDRLAKAAAFLLTSGLLVRDIRPSARRNAFFAFSVTAALVYSCNGGWVYTLYLLAAPLILTGAALLGNAPDTSESGQMRRKTAKASALLILGSLFLYNITLLEALFPKADTVAVVDPYDRFASVIEKSFSENHVQNFILLSDTLWSSTVASLNGAPHSLNPFDDGFWPLPWLLKHPSDPQAGWMWDKTFFSPFLQALQTNPAPYIVVDESPGQRNDIYGLLKPNTKAGELLTHYVQIAHADFCSPSDKKLCKYSLWKRGQ